jgi:hypothetical protein
MSQVGARYNTVGVLLNAPFVLNRRLCELPLVPGAGEQLLHERHGHGAAGREPQRPVLLLAVRAGGLQAGRPADHRADPRWVSPADLLHMREGDVPSIAATQPLRYVGHLKYNPPPLLAADGP